MKLRKTLAFFCLSAALVAGAGAQETHSHQGKSEALGTVHFPVACEPSVQADFTRAVALLHSFGYEEARKSFAKVAEQDPACGMASWGIAMTYYHPIWAPPAEAELAAGGTAAEKATVVGARTDREKGYITAIGAFYRDFGRVDHRARALAYKQAMEGLARRYPDDHEASIFYALALLGAAPPSDATFADQKMAADILNSLLTKEPQHPGVIHYLIHAYDYPPLAAMALSAARTYAKVAPSSPHALHMPSHIFTRLGLWSESIDSNRASADAARRLVDRTHPGAASFDALHALDYLEYAYLQIGDEPKARQVRDEAATAKTFDDPSPAAGYALADIPARFALERRRWDEAAKLEASDASLPWERFRYARAITHFAQALGSARSNEPERARAALANLEGIHAVLVKSPISGPYDWAGQVDSMRLAAAAWLAYSERRRDEAVDLARTAADTEDRVGKHSVTPGAVLPARELLADLLREIGRPGEALGQYEASLRVAPNRLNSLYGAARSAETSGASRKAAQFYTQLLDNCGSSHRAEVEHARNFLKRHRELSTGMPGGAAPATGNRTTDPHE
jgi:tetratricopeptide (TPR) repeat protein